MFGARYFGGRHFGVRYFGKQGLTAPGAYFGGRYFGGRYFGERYWSAEPAPGESFSLVQTAGVGLSGSIFIGSAALVFPAAFTVTQTNTIGLSGVIGVNGGLVIDETDTDFNLTPPLEGPALVGVLGVSGDIVIITGGDPVLGSYWGRPYFGGRYFGGRYFGRPPAFNLSVTQGVGLSGSVAVAAQLGVTIDLDFGAGLALTGSLGVGATEFTTPTPDPAPTGGRIIGRGRMKIRGPSHSRRLIEEEKAIEEVLWKFYERKEK